MRFLALTNCAKNQKTRQYLTIYNFGLYTIPHEEFTGNLKKAIDKSESLHTPWFDANYVYDYCKDEIIEEIKLNNYEFLETGEFISTENMELINN